MLILLNGVFSGAEIAILSVRRTRLQELVESGSGGARAVARLRENPERFLATVQVGITVVGATAAAFGGSSVAARLQPAVAAVPVLAESAEQISLAIVVAGVSFLSLVLGELVPKSLALRAAEPYALFIGRPLSAVAWATRPLIWLLTASSNVVLRLFGDKTSFTEARLSPEELRQLVDEAASAGTVDAHIGEIASRALDLGELDLETVMVPRSQMVSVPKTATVAQIAQLACEKGHARVLFHGGDPEDILGFLNVREVLARSVCEPEFAPEKALHPVPFLPDTMAASAALRSLQQERSHLAVVVDEQGGVRGIVTLEDLLEELVGDILSEGDTPRNEVRREADGSIVLPAAIPIHEANREFGLELPEGESVSTVGGLCTERAGRIPTAGASIAVEGYVIEVVEATPRRVKTVRVRRDPNADAAAAT